MVFRGAEVLLDILEGKSVEATTRLPTPMIVRRSCGCQDPSLVWAAVGASNWDVAAKISLDSRRAGIIAAMGQSIGGALPERAWLERLVDAFLAELRRRGECVEGGFLQELESTLYQVSRADSDILVWQEAISTLRRLSVPYLGPEELGRAEDLLQQARVMVGLAAQRQVVAAGQNAADRLDILRRIQGELITTFDIDALMNALAENLPRIGVSGCYLSLYENPQPYRYPQSAPQSSRQILAFSAKGRLDAERDADPFPTRRLCPDGIWPEGRGFFLVAEPIFFQKSQLGFVLFEIGTQDGAVYETLRGLISSALEGAMLMIKEQKRGSQLRAAALVSRASSSVIEFEDMLERVVRLLTDHFGLAWAGLFTIDEATGIATLSSSAGAGEAERANGDILAGACIDDARNRITIGAAFDTASFLSPDRSEMALPLASRGRVIGALSVRCSPGEAFDDDEVKVLQTLSDQIANAIENVRLFDAYKRAELDLKQERNLLRTIIDQIPEFIYVKDTKSRFLLSNRSFSIMKRARTPEELLGKTDSDYFAPELADEYLKEERRIVEDGESMLDHEHKRMEPGGENVWILTSKVPLRDSLGAIIGLVGVSRDITERKRGEEALRLQSARLQTALDVAGTVNALLDVELILECVAALIREKFGFYCVCIFLVDDSGARAVLRAISGPAAVDDLIGTVSFDLGGSGMIGSAVGSAEPRVAQDVSADPLYLASARLPDTRSEAVFPMLVGEATIGVLDVQCDTTDSFSPDAITILKTMAYQIAIAVQNARLHVDEQVRSRELGEAYKALKDNQERSLIAEKMASLGRLTAGIAHEMNTPIAALRSALMELGKLTDEYETSIGDASVTDLDHGEIASEMRASIRLATSAAERAAAFVKGIKTQTRNMGQVEKQRFNAVPVIEEALLLLRHALLKEKCSIDFAHSADRVDLIGSPGRLAQVMTNLVTNAMDACSGSEDPSIVIDLESRADFIELRVSDKGAGIPSENLSKIFDPLFTTKPIGQGTGLGLTIVHDIVVGEFGGKVEVGSVLGEGSTFTLRFPALGLDAFPTIPSRYIIGP